MFTIFALEFSKISRYFVKFLDVYWGDGKQVESWERDKVICD